MAALFGKTAFAGFDGEETSALVMDPMETADAEQDASKTKSDFFSLTLAGFAQSSKIPDKVVESVAACST